MAKVVIEANVIISAAFGGNPLRAVIRAMDEDEVYLTQAIERERGLFKVIEETDKGTAHLLE